eukprot:scaffold152879_cov33-Attheya_sp.AAC.1
MLFSPATGPNSIATLTETEASSMVGASASWRIDGSGDAVSVVGEFNMVGGSEHNGRVGRSACALKGSTRYRSRKTVAWSRGLNTQITRDKVTHHGVLVRCCPCAITPPIVPTSFHMATTR